jgi:hypothetical protein
MFADPDFDGDPSIETEQHIGEDGEPIDTETVVTPEEEPEPTDEVIVDPLPPG